MQPAMVGPYTLLRLLGEGSLGQVLLARTDRGARVALKVFRPEFAAYPRFRARLREEIDALTLVRSARVPAVLDADTEGDVPWLATEYVAAPPLHEVIAEGGPLELAATRRLGIGLTEALAAVHGSGGVHGDLKPANVLLPPDGPQVTDAGLARAAAATPLTRGGALVGTLGYLAPEQVVDGVAGPASDVFALGSVLLFAATWRRPFGDGDATAVLHRVLHGDPDLGGLAPDVATVVAACLHRDPERRPGLAQVRETLRAAAAADGDEIYPAEAAEAVAPAAIGPRYAAAPVAVPAPRRTLSPAHRVASAAAVSVTLLGLLAVTSADTTLAPHAPFGLHAPLRLHIGR
jgi:serine/threonine protein kinase